MLFERKKTYDDKPDSSFYPVEEDQEITTPVQLNVFLPESLVSSDINLSKLKTEEVSGEGTPNGPMYKKKFSDVTVHLSDLFWFVQYKESKDPTGYREDRVRLDKFLLRLKYAPKSTSTVTPANGITQLSSYKECFLMTDMFFDPATSYTAKALGVYSSIPKVLSVNFKHHGELHAERRDIPFKDWSGNVFIVSDSLKLEKRARSLFAYLELTSTIM